MRYLAEIADIANLKSAFRHIAANRGVPGVDGITIEQFAEQLDNNLNRISRQIIDVSYQFQPVLCTQLPREQRVVAILTVSDRLVSQAISQVIRTPLEDSFHPASYAYRLGRSAVHAAADMEKALQKGEFPHILRCDVYHFFNEIEHNTLFRFLSWSLEDNSRRTLWLILRSLRTQQLYDGQVQETIRGVCQGSPLSPLLSNLYLTPLDRYLERTGFRHFRFCDDVAILLKERNEVTGLLESLQTFLRDHLQLRLHPDKTKLVSYQEGFDFLGFHFSPQGRSPSKKGCERLRSRLKASSSQEEKLEAVRRWETYYGQDSAGTVIHNMAEEDKAKKHDIQERYPIIKLYRDLFQGNRNCFAQARKGNKKCRYFPVKRPLENHDLIAHLLGKETLGIYLLHQNRVRCACLDLDISSQIIQLYYGIQPGEFSVYVDRVLQQACVVDNILRKLGFLPVLEESGYKGYHVWLFFREFLPADLIIQFWQKILKYAGPAPQGIKREIFPRESRSNGGPGSLIKLPLGIHPQSGQRSMLLDAAGEPISNPLGLLSNIEKASQENILKVIEGRTTLKEPQSNVEKILAGCRVLRYLYQKARRENHLGHFERLILLYTFGQLGEEGAQELHRTIGHCTNYNYDYTQRQLDKKKPTPIGCRRIQEIMGAELEQVQCNCSLEIPPRGFRSPILHVYPQATRNLGGRRP